MKLLFIAPLLDMSGFAEASRRFLKTLVQNPKFDVACRVLKYDQLDPGQKFITPQWMEPLFKKSITNSVEMALQMTTCNVEANPIPGVLNGLYTFLESDRLQISWANKANEFDFLIVPCRANAQAMVRSGVTKPILVCPLPCDSDTYTKLYTPYNIANANGRTIFYNICQLSQKKGIDLLLRAYYAAFCDRPDEVLLVLKTYINMQNRSGDLELVKQYINNVKTNCRIPTQKLPPVLPLVFSMTNDEIHGLHKASDAYVCTSRSEGWNIPLFDAMCHGKLVISNTYGGMADYIDPGNALTYSGISSFFYGCQHPDPGLYTGLEQCLEPCVPEVALLMRQYHLLKIGHEAGILEESKEQEWNSIINRQQNSALLKDKFDYRMVAPKVNTQLEDFYRIWKRDGKININETNPEIATKI